MYLSTSPASRLATEARVFLLFIVISMALSLPRHSGLGLHCGVNGCFLGKRIIYILAKFVGWKLAGAQCLDADVFTMK